MITVKKIQFFLSISILLLSVCSCSVSNKYRYAEGVAWNTLYHITYESDKDLEDSIISILKEIDLSLSPFNRESTISKINDNREIMVDSHFKNVYNESKNIHKETGGLFDPTLGPVIRAWGFGKGHTVSEDTLHIDSLLMLVGLDKTSLKNDTLIKQNPDIEFNFSAIAKGYGVDCVAKMLERNGVDNFLVEIGGEIRAAGHNQAGNNWSIGIDVPDSDAPQGETAETIFIDNASVATSGNYRNFHNNGERQFGHTISPVTGMPITTDVVSATVISQTCMEADALATSVMVMGATEAFKLCNKLKVGLMVIKTDGSISSNSFFNAYLSK